MYRASLISIGDELTLGQCLNTNTCWLAARLAEHSALTVEHRTIPDDRAAIALAVAQLSRTNDLLILTGGLGPTADDLTREALADAISPAEPLVTDQTALNHLRNWFQQRGRQMPQINLKQAQRPASMQCMENPLGTAPGLAGAIGSCRVFALPGPPHEMQAMFLNHVLPRISPHLPSPGPGHVFLTAAVHEYGLGESMAAQLLGPLMDRDRNPLVGTTASHSIVSARIRATGQAAQSRQLLEDTTTLIERLWRPYAYGRGSETLSSAVGNLLRQKARKLVVAESCTGGWLGKAIVDVPNSSDYFLGGWICYSNQLKTSCLNVPAELIEAHGAVSAPVAAAMALGAIDASSAAADVALSITGIAGPEGATADKPVGTVFVALAQRRPGELQAWRRTGLKARSARAVPPGPQSFKTSNAESFANPTCVVRHFEFPGDRTAVRDRSVKSALQMLRFALLEVPDSTALLWQRAQEGAT